MFDLPVEVSDAHFLVFFIIGVTLLGLLYVAEAQLGPPKTLSVSTNFYGLPAPYKSENAIPVLTVRDAPAPVPTEVAVQQLPIELLKPQAAKLNSQRKPKIAGKIARQKLNPNRFAERAMGPRTPHFMW